jgi:general secretion pathway protein E
MLDDLLNQFVNEGLITERQLQEARNVELETGEPSYRFFRDRGMVPEERLLAMMADKLGLRYMKDLSTAKVPEEFASKVSLRFARAYSLIGIERKDGVIVVATSDPLFTEPLDEAEGMLGCEIEPVIADRSEITALINRTYVQGGNVEEMLDDLNPDEIIGMAEAIEESEDVLDIAYKAPIIKLVNMLFFEALRMRASDIHLQPYEDKLQVRYRIDGILHDTQMVPKKVQEAVVSRIKVMGRMDIAERRLPQDGRTTIRVSDAEVDVRISSVPTSHGERIVMRLLDKSARLYELTELGLDERNLKLIDSLIHYSHGIIFVTGPTGSGKTTTLYAALQRINSLEKNILTIEDPIEYNLKDVSQIQVSAKKGLTFASGLRSLLRQDPDIMMVGEVRDVETARIAIQSALTGHLVFSTLHTNDAPGAVTRMLDIGVEPYLVSSSLIGVVAQRLVRLICERCKYPYVPTDSDLREIGLDMSRVKDGVLYRGKGCHHCMGTGYWNRTGIYEILPMTEGIRELVVERAGANIIKHAAVNEGMKTLRMDGARKVLEGISTVEEVLRVTQLDMF